MSVWGSFLKNIRKTGQLSLIKTIGTDPTPMFRSAKPAVDGRVAVEIYRKMTELRVMERIMSDAQRQGRISFFMTSLGEEGISIGSAAALKKGDILYGQYREAGALLWLGLGVDDMINQCYGTAKDASKGRQMPIHYGSKEHNFHPISSPLATQIPQAPGAAYTLKQDKADNISVCYFGDGAASEGDFHAGLGFASTMDLPVLFMCRNNGIAISTRADEQYRGDGILAKAVGHGIDSIRVDGTCPLSVYEATLYARRKILETSRPVLIEAMAYRIGNHSTSDDSTKYRSQEEINRWLEPDKDCLQIIRAHLEVEGLWTDADEQVLQQKAKSNVLQSIKDAENTPSVADDQIEKDVYN